MISWRISLSCCFLFLIMPSSELSVIFSSAQLFLCILMIHYLIRSSNFLFPLINYQSSNDQHLHQEEPSIPPNVPTAGHMKVVGMWLKWGAPCIALEKEIISAEVKIPAERRSGIDRWAYLIVNLYFIFVFYMSLIKL